MANTLQENSFEKASFWEWVFRLHLPLELETALFIVVNALDIFMTHQLFTSFQQDRHDVVFYESNPVARFFLDSWGVPGIVFFKFSMVAVVAVIAQIIALQKVRTARLLLIGATAMVFGVVLYSVSLVY